MQVCRYALYLPILYGTYRTYRRHIQLDMLSLPRSLTVDASDQDWLRSLVGPSHNVFSIPCRPPPGKRKSIGRQSSSGRRRMIPVAL